MDSLKREALTSLFTVSLLLLMMGTPVLALEIISPVDGSIVGKATRLILKGGDKPPIDAITIKVNAEKSDLIDISSTAYRQSFRDFVFLEATFDPGVNQIEVEGYASGKRVATVKTKVYLPEGVLEPPPPFVKKIFHTAERESLCAGCHHNLNPKASDLANPVPGQNPCSTCHNAIFVAKYVHGPAGVYDCSACHDLESRPGKYAVPDADGRFCADCHDDVVARFKNAKFVHGPAQASLCLVCHDPHSSESPGMIRAATINESCSLCHESVEKSKVHAVRTINDGSHPLAGKNNPALPGKPFHCASCHDPHQSETSTLLVVSGGGMALCVYCHKK